MGKSNSEDFLILSWLLYISPLKTECRSLDYSVLYLLAIKKENLDSKTMRWDFFDKLKEAEFRSGGAKFWKNDICGKEP